MVILLGVPIAGGSTFLLIDNRNLADRVGGWQSLAARMEMPRSTRWEPAPGLDGNGYLFRDGAGAGLFVVDNNGQDNERLVSAKQMGEGAFHAGFSPMAGGSSSPGRRRRGFLRPNQIFVVGLDGRAQ
jgi:hypothetical protein